MKNLRLAVPGLAGLVLLCAPAVASAQSHTGFAIDRYEPAERGSRFFVVDSLDLRGNLRPALGATFDYGYKPLVFYSADGQTEKSAIVRHQLFAHLGGSLVVADRFRFGLNVPVAIFQDGEDTLARSDQLKGATKAALGDVRLAADVRLVGEKGDAFTLAGGVRAWLPTGVRSQFTSDGSLRIAPQLLAAGDVGMFTYGARVAVVYRTRDDAYAGSDLGSEVTGAAGAGLRVLDDTLVVGPELFASSVFSGTDTFFKTRATPVEWLFGAHYSPTKDLLVGAGVGSGLTRGYGAPQVRGLLSVEWAPAYEKPDRDADRIPDESDACPTVPGVRSADPRKNGCPPEAPPPPPPPDSDGDGILDKDDACPTDRGVRTDDPATNGCPDRDGDGIMDAVDACPDKPGKRTTDPKTNGCPDRDDDGVFDVEDACPDVPGPRDPDPKRNGCPDTDGDGILDSEDACPKVAGPANSDPKRNGCPLVIVTEKEIKITEQVKFRFNSAEILKDSDAVLTAVKKVLDANPDITKVRVEGHTDNVGDAAYNKALSGRRAASVMKWLTDHGVDKKRLVSAGYGKDEPIDTNTTEEGRANNRRVAFTILQRDEAKKPAPAAPGAPGAPGAPAAPAPTPKP